MQWSRTRKLFIRTILGTLLAAGTACSVAGCSGGGGGDFGPEITSATITPSTVQEEDTGMTDECFTVELTTSGFEEEISEVTIFIVDTSRSATAFPGTTTGCSTSESPTFDESFGDITVDGIVKSSLVQGLSPGEYGIGATVEDEFGTSVTERNLTFLTIE